MKKWFFIVGFAVGTIQLSRAGDVITQDAMHLPLTARNFINRHFEKPKISYIKIEKDWFKAKKYEVLLTDRTEIEFDSRGNWLEVYCKRKAVPATLVPGYVQAYLDEFFPEAFITQIERDKGIEVELSNDYSLKFNQKGELVDIDD